MWKLVNAKLWSQRGKQLKICYELLLPAKHQWITFNVHCLQNPLVIFRTCKAQHREVAVLVHLSAPLVVTKMLRNCRLLLIDIGVELSLRPGLQAGGCLCRHLIRGTGCLILAWRCWVAFPTYWLPHCRHSKLSITLLIIGVGRRSFWSLKAQDVVYTEIVIVLVAVVSFICSRVWFSFYLTVV